MEHDGGSGFEVTMKGEKILLSASTGALQRPRRGMKLFGTQVPGRARDCMSMFCDCVAVIVRHRGTQRLECRVLAVPEPDKHPSEALEFE
ncbi:MAG TPA: hypothetical protein VHM25_00900, partial [Polyangiaceae bacterium]|nr:hypothetical protein [Polyangiaceae bacterium]